MQQYRYLIGTGFVKLLKYQHLYFLGSFFSEDRKIWNVQLYSIDYRTCLHFRFIALDAGSMSLKAMPKVNLEKPQKKVPFATKLERGP